MSLLLNKKYHIMKNVLLIILISNLIWSCNDDKGLFNNISAPDSGYKRYNIEKKFISFTKRRPSGTVIDSLVFRNKKIDSYHYKYRNLFISSFYYLADTIFMYEGSLGTIPFYECYDSSITEDRIKVFNIVPVAPPNYILKAEILRKNRNDKSFQHEANCIFKREGYLGYYMKGITEQTEYLIRYKLESTDSTKQFIDSTNIILKICDE